MRRHLFALVSVVSWLNVAAVAARYQVGRPAFTSTIRGPDQLDAILTNPFSSVGRLSGLFGLPDLLGVTMAVALAFQVRYLAHLASTGRRWTAALLAVVGALPTAGLCGSPTRDGPSAAVVVGLLIALLPRQRFRDGWPPAAARRRGGCRWRAGSDRHLVGDRNHRTPNPVARGLPTVPDKARCSVWVRRARPPGSKC